MSSRSIHILYIDDDGDDRDIFVDAIQTVEPTVVCQVAADGSQALRMLSESLLILPDYIFLDMNMPVMGGLEFLKVIKKIPRLRTIPVIVYSTSTPPSERKNFLDLGVHEVLTKPSSYPGLIDLLGKVLKVPCEPIGNAHQ